MPEKKFALSKINYIICGVAALLIVLGFIIMAVGPASTVEAGFQSDIFSVRRIKVAPVISLIGFVLMIVGILYPSKKEENQN